MITRNHRNCNIHIEQFNETYYDALEVFEAIEEAGAKFGISEARFSSTSSCRDDVELLKIEEEISYALSYSGKLTVRPYLWFVPSYAEEGISVFSATKSFDYCGIKLHPAGQNWDEENPKHLNALHEIFRWADENAKSVLIHCGPQKCDLPTRLEEFFAEYTNANIILAHSNPVRETSLMVNKYKNVFCDTACIEKKDFQKLRILVNDKSKIFFGSDFPVTQYFNQHLFNKNFSLKEEYEHDCETLTW